MTNRALVDHRPRRRRGLVAPRRLTRRPARRRTSSSTASPPLERRARRPAAARAPAAPRKSKIASTSRRTSARCASSPSGAEADRVADRVGHQRAAAAGRARTSCVWCHSAYGPRTCTSTKRCGGSHSWIDVRQRDRHAVEAQPVLDERAGAHRRSGRGVDDPEAQQRRRDRLEVARVGEEREDLRRACRAAAARAAACGCASPSVLRPDARTRWSDLRSAPVPPLRADDHVRGPRRTRRCVLFYARLHVPALRARRARGCARAACGVVLPPLRAAGEAPARASPLRPRRRGRRARRARSGSCTTRSTPTRAASTTRTCGRAASALGLDLDRFEADRRGAEARRAGRARRARRAARAGATATPDARAPGRGRGSRNCCALPMGAVRIRESKTTCGPPTDGRARKGSPHMSSDAVTTVSVEIAGSEISFETGKMARQASRRRRRPPGRHDGPQHRDRRQPPRRRLPPADGRRRGAHVRRGQDPRLVLQARGSRRREGHADRAHDRPPDPPALPEGLALRDAARGACR